MQTKMKPSARTYILGLHLILSLTEQVPRSLANSTLYITLFSCPYLVRRLCKRTAKVFEMLLLLVFLCFSHGSFPAQCFLAFSMAQLFPKFKPIFLPCLAAALLFRAVLYIDLYSLSQILIVLYTYLRQEPRTIPKTRQKTEEDWKQLCNALPYGVAVQAVNTGKWSYCNPALCELLDAPVPDVAFIKMEGIKNRLTSDSTMIRVNRQLTDKIGGGTFAGPEKSENEQPDLLASLSFEDAESKKLFDISCKTIKWNEESAYLYTLKDVTEKHKIEHLRLANLIKSRILRSLSHELRTPINCILNSLEYCKQKLAGDEESWANINIALTNTNILLNKYNDILDFLKIEMGQLELECASFDIRELIKEVSNLLALQIEFRGLQYKYEIDDRIPKEIYSDPNRILQVVLNLVENAIKYNKQDGSIKLFLKSLPQISRSAIEVTVNDTGQGIDLERLSTLFSLEEIGNEKHSSKRASVSLPIAYHICKKLGGELKVNTQLGHGSTFTFQIVPRKGLLLQEEEEEESQEMNEKPEWDMEEDSDDIPVAHVPLETTRMKPMGACASATSHSVARGVHMRSIHRRQRLDSEGSQMAGWRSGRDDSAKKSLAFTDMTPEVTPIAGLRLNPRTNKMMLQEIIKSIKTPKRSFSFGDLPWCKGGKEHKDVSRLKQRIAKVKEFRTLLRQTIRRDVDSIRSNIIRSKNELFLPSIFSRPKINMKKKSTYDIKTAAPSRVRNVRHELLNFHIDHELVRNDHNYPPALGDFLFELQKIDEESKGDMLPTPKMDLLRKKPNVHIKRGLCIFLLSFNL